MKEFPRGLPPGQLLSYPSESLITLDPFTLGSDGSWIHGNRLWSFVYAARIGLRKQPTPVYRFPARVLDNRAFE